MALTSSASVLILTPDGGVFHRRNMEDKDLSRNAQDFDLVVADNNRALCLHVLKSRRLAVCAVGLKRMEGLWTVEQDTVGPDLRLEARLLLGLLWVSLEGRVLVLSPRTGTTLGTVGTVEGAQWDVNVVDGGRKLLMVPMKGRAVAKLVDLESVKEEK